MRKPRHIYRSKALERLSSPEAVDQLLYVIKPRDWLALAAAGILILLFLTWSVIGSVPATVSGHSVFVQPRTILPIQVPASGRLARFALEVGDYIKEGEVLGLIDQTDVTKSIEEDRRLLAELERQNREKTTLQDRQFSLQDQQVQAERDFIHLQNETLKKTFQDAEALAPKLKNRLEGLRLLKTQGLISELSSDLLQAEQSVLDNETRRSDLQAKMKQLDAQQRELETRRGNTARENLEASSSRNNEIQEVISRIARAELQLRRQGEIRSPFTGRIVEVTSAVGKILNAGDQIATIQTDGIGKNLISIAYFSVGDGKKILPGMTVQVTPDTVERQRFGGIVGVVESVSELPVTKAAAMLTIGDAAIVDLLMPEGPFIQVNVQLQADNSTYSGYKWSSSSGPATKISAGTTSATRVMIETRRPITYVFPFLRSLSGIH